MEWLNRTLFTGPRLALVTSEAEFLAAKVSAGLECSDALLGDGWEAATHSYVDNDGQLVCIVGINLAACEKLDGIAVAALLAHESVHVWQRVRDGIGPGDLGREMEAYAIQNIVDTLMRRYVTLTSSREGIASTES